MTDIKNIGFKKLYAKTKVNYPNLIDLSESDLNFILSQSESDFEKSKISRYIIAVIGASLTILLFVCTVIKVYGLLGQLSEYIRTSNFKLSEEAILNTNLVLCIFCSSLIIYVYLVPHINLFKKIAQAKSSTFNINTKAKIFIKFKIISSYFILGVLLLFTLLNFGITNSLLVILKLYLLLPLTIAAFFVTIYSIIYLLVIPLKKYLKTKEQSNERTKIAFLLCNVLNRLNDNKNRLHFIEANDLEYMLSKLSYASSLIKNYPYKLTSRIPSQSIIETFSKASNEVDRLIFSIATIDNGKVVEIQTDLINYLNSILSGDLINLPKSEDAYFDKHKDKRIRPYKYFLLALYLILPLLLVISLNVFFKFSFTEYTQSLLKILYIIWAFVGIFSNPIILTSENKDLIKDILKSWFGK